MSEKLREMKRIAAEAFTAGWLECARYPLSPYTDGHARVAAEARYLSTLAEISTPPRCGSEKLREKIATVLRDCDGRPLVDYVDRILVALAESPKHQLGACTCGKQLVWVGRNPPSLECPTCDAVIPGPSQAWVETMNSNSSDGLELAWGLIANAWAFVEREEGETSRQWLEAAARWRDEHWHGRLKDEREADPASTLTESPVTAVEWESYGAGLDDVQLVSKQPSALPVSAELATGIDDETDEVLRSKSRLEAAAAAYTKGGDIVARLRAWPRDVPLTSHQACEAADVIEELRLWYKDKSAQYRKVAARLRALPEDGVEWYEVEAEGPAGVWTLLSGGPYPTRDHAVRGANYHAGKTGEKTRIILHPERPPQEEESRMIGGLGPACIDCGLLYSDPGFADLVVAHDVWAKISPTGHEGGLLCPTCMVRAATKAGIEARATFRSGPFFAEPGAPQKPASPYCPTCKAMLWGDGSCPKGCGGSDE